MDGVSVITCTGGRPAAFELCRLYLTRQSFTGPIQWIVVNDVDGFGVVPPTGYNLPRIEVQVLMPRPTWRPGENTLARNLLTALPHARYDRILFFEDDDWYDRLYIETAARLLNSVSMVGFKPAHYYNVAARKWRIMDNKHYASLCQTAIRRSVVPDLLKLIRENKDSIDANLWLSAERTRALYSDYTPLCVGIKSMPGRPGIGVGHRPEGNEWADDRELAMLCKWVGNDDLSHYRGFIN